MKVVKRLFIGILLIAITGTFAISEQAEARSQNSRTKRIYLKHFVYTLYPNTSPTNVNNPYNYDLTSDDGMEPLLCSPGGYICGVIAEDDGAGHPNFAKGFTFVTRN